MLQTFVSQFDRTAKVMNQQGFFLSWKGVVGGIKDYL
jgi:hypothetical protein